MTLRQIYNALTGDFNLVNVESGWTDEVANYSALPTASLHDGEVYLVLNSQGTAWLPGTLGGTFYSKGFYKSISSAWEFLGAVPYQATQSQVNTGTATDVFVSPSTLANSTQWDSKVSSVVAGTNVTVDNTDPLNPVISASGGGGSFQTLPEIVYDAMFAADVNKYYVCLGAEDPPYTCVFTDPASPADGEGYIVYAIGRTNIGGTVYESGQLVYRYNNGAWFSRLISLPSGGTAGQSLTKIDGTDFNVQWATPASGGINETDAMLITLIYS